MSLIHRRAFEQERGWTSDEVAALLASPHVFAVCRAHGFALIRVVAEEAELLTLAVDPAHRREGIADAIMTEWMQNCDATEAFLEVAEDNHAARALYARHRFAQAGCRRAYYARADGPAADALLMRAPLTRGQMP
ncbi:GNAT family N-acetyltransferase [uncultured Roseobacter sp.]|uniref:GNAT family N-acetyltransferase n=1 Tax=uncultured Roseobacter sp. TaxID=114847 RepID=UPI00262551D3|nr:GNAT family N-acetyltransferase [uncultured Roseobacter sp.]